MPPNPTCPACAGLVDWRVIERRSYFRCPHCHELLRTASHGTSALARYGIIGLITLGLLTRHYGWIGWILILYIAYPLAMLLAHAVVIFTLGPTIESVANAGHIPIGEWEE